MFKFQTVAEAAEHGDLDELKRMHQAGYCIKGYRRWQDGTIVLVRTKTPMYYASYHNHLNIVKYLIEQGS